MAVSQNKVVTPQGLVSGNAICTAQKSTYNDAANAVLLFTAGVNGAVVYGITAETRATLAAALQLQLYRSRDSGTTLFLLNEIVMAAYTIAATTAPTQSDFGYSEIKPLRMAAGEQLYVGIATAVAGGVCFDCQAENL